ncbi:hypothetical protein I4F81_011096 [Pyropia yezoensis]|uniref:Uncharacterized protein n=1 Tax=Pyropia yezoensis TaxID=2788 RepID=A0ACC3CFR3_PYRYE|nr:hypothetical protein I4F81_011096 [Neopyropia yezoensis]
MAFVLAHALVTRHGRPPSSRPRRQYTMAVPLSPRGADGGLPRTAWVAAPATAATAARAAARVGAGGVADGGWRRAAAAAPATATAPDRDAVDEAALRAADIQEALADLADLRSRVLKGEERLGSPATEAGAARRLRAMDALTASLEAELGSLEFAR